LSLAATYAEHRYDFDRDITGGEVVRDGNMMDTAPRWLANARWRMLLNDRIDSEFEVNYNAKHYINAENTAEYDGHVVFNWRGRYTLNNSTTIFARVVNLFDEEYADRADFTVFNPLNYRYFPAMPRQIYVGVTLDL
jgi:outer membrane receptor protein involved in Fe transport